MMAQRDENSQEKAGQQTEPHLVDDVFLLLEKLALLNDRRYIVRIQPAAHTQESK